VIDHPAWTPETFDALVHPHRRELLVHCYRMLGSIDDAEDAVQEALTRAWFGRDTYIRSISLRAWLYKIATNASLNAIERRTRSRRAGLSVVPVPDAVLGGVTAWDPGPEARYAARESISLAFLTVLQLLPPRQRAILLLRDVLSWHADEVADLLDLSVPAVNSALQRARATVRTRFAPAGEGAVEVASPLAPQLRSLLDRYVRAWEAADIAGLVRLLRDEAVLAMPPMPSVVGGKAIGAFLADRIFAGRAGRQLIETEANGQPAFVAYSQPAGGGPFAAVSLLVLTVEGDRVARLDAYANPAIIARFGLPSALPG
jgi:RNA polymerase sigma-70 factor (ECF subfamily)